MLQILLAVGRDHEIALRRHFEDAVYYAGKVVFDYPLYLLAFSNRCGSNLAAEYIRSLRGFDGFREELNQDVVIRASCQGGFGSLSDYVSHHCRAAFPSTYGFKANWEQLSMVFKFGLHRMFSDCRIVHIVREDVVGQAISYSIGTQRGVWTSTDRSPPMPVTFDYDDIAMRLGAAVRDVQAIELIAAVTEAPYLRLTYEGFVSDPFSQLARFVEFTGMNTTIDRSFVPALTKQGDGINDEYRARFLENIREKFLTAPNTAPPPRPDVAR